MVFPTSDIVGLIYNLLPGFVAAWIFYGLTAHPKPTPFERVVQALIFTAFIQAVVIPLGWLLLRIGRSGCTVGVWTENTALVVGVFVGIGLGLFFVSLVNSNKLHDWLFRKGISKRTAYPSEWYSAFHRCPRHVYLHLASGRRIFGWPEEWPDQPSAGHFVLMGAEWILDDNRRMPLNLTERLLVPAADVQLVEFEKPTEAWDFNLETQKAIEREMVALQEPEKIDEREGEPGQTDEQQP